MSIGGIRDYLIYDTAAQRIFLNASALWSGNGLVDTGASFSQKEQFLRYEREAQTKHRGLWNTPAWRGKIRIGFADRLEAVFMFSVPFLFWLGLAFGIYMSVSSSSRHFLGTQWLTRSFFIVAALFGLNIIHGFGVPFLFGRMFWEYVGVIGLLTALFALSSWQDYAAVEAELAKDPRLKRCPKCRSIVDRIAAECPKCRASL
jgi:hypothetical protein